MTGQEGQSGAEALVVANGEIAVVPLDQKILGGLALCGTLTETELIAVGERLQAAFIDMRSNPDDEQGACLAYAVGISDEDEERVDDALLKIAEAENHGMLTRGALQTQHQLWSGDDGNKLFALHKDRGYIPMSDDSIPEGIVYSLLSSRRSS